MLPMQNSEADGTRIASAVREARARILWGDPVSVVLDFMMDAGVEGAFAQTVVAEAMKERGKEIRKSGLREITLGGLLLVMGGAGLLLVVYTGMISVILLGGTLTVVCYAGFRMLRGIIRLIAGPRAALDVSAL